MAGNKNNAGAPSAPVDGNNFDYSKYLPQGVKIEDTTSYESLTPIYAAEKALADNWPPVVGYAYATEALKTLRPGEANEYTPIMIRVQLAHPTKAQSGTGETIRDIDLKPGDDIYIPVNANLELNKRLEAAIIDPEKVHYLIFRVTGSQKMKPGQNPMWTWEVIDANTPKPRAGKFAFASAEVMKLDGSVLQLVQGGTANPVTGEVVDRVPAQAQQAS